jgi:ABC-type uncharacterized transport system auxiliary subunit
MKATGLITIVAFAILLIGCQPAANTNSNQNMASTAKANPAWDAHVEQYLNGYFAGQA